MACLPVLLLVDIDMGSPISQPHMPTLNFTLLPSRDFASKALLFLKLASFSSLLHVPPFYSFLLPRVLQARQKKKGEPGNEASCFMQQQPLIYTFGILAF